jgi:hypothetical protein
MSQGDTTDQDRALEEEIVYKKQDIASAERQLTKAKSTDARDSLILEISDLKSELATLQASLDKLRGIGGKRRARKTRKAKKTHKKRTMKHRR